MPDNVWRAGALRPDQVASTSTERRLYVALASSAPGLYHAIWQEFRVHIEPWRKLPGLHRSYFEVVNGTKQDAIVKWAECLWEFKNPTPDCEDWKRLRILPPPPRPTVEVRGPHVWVVYIGREPGLYRTA